MFGLSIWQIILMVMGLLIIWGIIYFNKKIIARWRNENTEEEIQMPMFYCPRCLYTSSELGDGECPRCSGKLKKVDQKAEKLLMKNL